MATDKVHLPETGVTAELYRAAIGARGQDYYLRQFARFDADGKTGPTWHWPAYWATVNWLVYRRMWRHALAYVGALLVLALLIFGVGKLVLSYSDATGLWLFLLFLTVAYVVPGLYANAWFYTYCNAKISATLRSSHEIKDACDSLAQEASSSQQWFGLAAVNVAAMALLAGVLTFDLTPVQDGARLAEQRPSPQLASGAVTVATQPLAAPSDVPRPELQPAALTAQAVAAPSAISGDTGSQSEPSATPQTAAVQVADHLEQKSAVPAVPGRLAKPNPVPAAVAGTAQAQTRSDVASPSVAVPPRPVPRTKPAPAAAAAARPAPPAQARYVWFVQVGAYAQADNVQKARARIEELGLQTAAEPVTVASGQLTRVRVGPFTRQDEAEKAALRIRALDLPALVLRHRS